MSKKGSKTTIEKLVDESIEEVKSEKKTEKQDTLDEKLLEIIDEDIKKEEDETRNRLVPLPKKLSKEKDIDDSADKFAEGLDTVTNVKEIGGVEDDEENDIKSTTEVRPNKPIIVGKEDLPSCSCEEDSDHTETTSEPTNKPDEMTSKEAVAAMQSQVRRSWKGKFTFAVIMIVCISLAYYKPMYPNQDFFNNLTYYIIFIGILAPLLLYIVVNEFDKYLKKKKGIDITKNHKDSLLVKQDKPKNTQPRAMSPLTASVLGTYYTMLEKTNNTSLDTQEKPKENKEENTEEKVDDSEDKNSSVKVSEEISGILSDMLSESDDECKDGICKKSGKKPEESEETPDPKPDLKSELNPTKTAVSKSDVMPESKPTAKTETKPRKKTEGKQDEQPE